MSLKETEEIQEESASHPLDLLARNVEDTVGDVASSLGEGIAGAIEQAAAAPPQPPSHEELLPPGRDSQASVPELLKRAEVEAPPSHEGETAREKVEQARQQFQDAGRAPVGED